MIRMVETIDPELIDIERCRKYGYDCSPEQQWTVINSSRKDTIYYYHKIFKVLCNV